MSSVVASAPSYAVVSSRVRLSCYTPSDCSIQSIVESSDDLVAFSGPSRDAETPFLVYIRDASPTFRVPGLSGCPTCPFPKAFAAIVSLLRIHYMRSLELCEECG